MKRTKLEYTRTVLRLATETPVSVETLAKVLKISKESVRRWATSGGKGVYLDVVEIWGKWFSSRPELARFADACGQTLG